MRSRDPKLAYMESLAADTFGIDVSVDKKLKTLDKFGENSDLDATTKATRKTVATLQEGAGANETLQTTNSITHIQSGTAGDTSVGVRVEGHYLTGDGDLVFIVQNATTNASKRYDASVAINAARPLYTTLCG